MKQVILTSIQVDELVQLLSIKIVEAIKDKKELESVKTVYIERKPDYLTRKETAELCKVSSPTTLWNWEQQGKLVPKRKSGKKPLYLRKDVEEFLKGNFNDSNSKAA